MCRPCRVRRAIWVSAPSKPLEAEPLERKAWSFPPLAALQEWTTSDDPQSVIVSASTVVVAVRPLVGVINTSAANTAVVTAAKTR